MTPPSTPPPAPCACGCDRPVVPSPAKLPQGTPKIYATPACAARVRQRRARGGLTVPTVVVCRVCNKGVVREAGSHSGGRRRYHAECAKFRRYACLSPAERAAVDVPDAAAAGASGATRPRTK